MPPSQNNDSSEDFGKIPNDSETFGNIPNRSERKENHVLSVHSVARMFEDAGVARTERSVTNWCQPDKNGVAKLDCFYDQNERKYYITPQSVERAIEEERSKIYYWRPSACCGNFRKYSEVFGKFRKRSEHFRTESSGATKRYSHLSGVDRVVDPPKCSHLGHHLINTNGIGHCRKQL